MYSDADVYLLDDPLSAVDAHVGHDMFHKGIKEALVKRGKTVILVTHQVQFLEDCDLIVILDNGRVKAQGTFQELGASGLDIESIVPRSTNDEAGDEGEGAADVASGGSTPRTPRTPRMRQPSMDGGAASPRDRALTRDRAGSARSSKAPSVAHEEHGLMTDEEKNTGGVGWDVYWFFMSAGSVLSCVSIVLVCLGGQVSDSASSYLLADWGKENIISVMTTGKYLNSYQNVAFLGKYAWLKMITCGSVLISYLLIRVHGLKASKSIHLRLLRRLLNAPIRFYDTTPQVALTAHPLS